MVTTGAMTNRIDRLLARGLVEREGDAADRRRVVVRLTETGRRLVDDVAPDHYRLEEELLASLSPTAVKRVESALRTILVDLGDVPPQA
jgi:DNA-binding MarR family transcriptional regulator